MLWLEVVFPLYTFLLCCVYRPPNSDNSFWDQFYLSLESAANQNDKIIVTGDLNVDLLSERSHKLLDIMNHVGLQNYVNVPTRFGPSRNSLLDLVLAKECSINHVEVLDIDRSISDHNATVAEINIETNFKKNYKRDIWDYKRGNFEQFNKDIEETDWSTLFSDIDNDVNDNCELFTSKFIELANKNIPNKTVTVRINDKPWFNGELR